MKHMLDLSDLLRKRPKGEHWLIKVLAILIGGVVVFIMLWALIGGVK